MPKSKENLKRELYDYLASKDYHPVSYDISGKVQAPEESEIMQFHFHMNDRDYGSVTITIGGINEMNVFFNDSLLKSLNKYETNGNPDGTTLIKELKRFAVTHGLTFSKFNMDELGPYLKRVHYTNKLDEGYYGTSRTSYNDRVPESVKMIIRHNTKMKEGDQRFRHIEKIFLENSLGERVMVPTKSPNHARAFAVHLADGGKYCDERWNHLAEMLTDIRTLKEFLHATKSSSSDSVKSVCNEAGDHCAKLQGTMKSVRSPRGYRKYFESWSPSVTEADDTALTKLFGEAVVDRRISEAIPVLSRLGVSASPIHEADEFERWADNMVDEGLEPTTDGQIKGLLALVGPDSDELPVGPDAINAIGKLSDLIEDEVLYDRLHKIAVANPDTDARPTIVAWIQEQNSPVYKQLSTKITAPAEPEPATPKEEPEGKAEPKTPAPAPSGKKPAPKPTEENPLAEESKKKQIKEVDNPDYQQSTTSAIPGTPASLQPQPTEEDMIAYEKEMKTLKKFMGHRS